MGRYDHSLTLDAAIMVSWYLGKKSTSVLLFETRLLKTIGLFQHQIGTTEHFDLMFGFAMDL